MKVAVLGAGNGGVAVAFEWAQAGHDVSLFDFERFGTAIAAINARGGIEASGDLSGFQELAYAGHDIAQVVPEAELIFAVGPAYSTAPFAQACRPHVRPGQIYVVCPSSCAGAVVFKRGLGLDLTDPSVPVAETSTLPYAVRLTGPAHLTVYGRLKGGYFVAALPSAAVRDVHDVLREVYPEMGTAASVLETTLGNANPVIHPAVTICNAGLIERTGGDFLFYEEGVTNAVGRLIEALDAERVAIGKPLGFTVVPDPEIGMEQGDSTENNYSTGYSQDPGLLGIMAQPRLDHRYLNEDAGYGLVFFTDLARQVGVPTPTMDAVLQISSVLRGTDYVAAQARTMASLGLDGYSIEQLNAL